VPAFLLPLFLACAAPVPLEGHWSVGSGEVLTDDCEQVDPEEEGLYGAGYTLQREGEGFTLSEDDGAPPLECALDGREVACAPIETSDSGSQGGDSYTVTQTSTTTGEVEAEDAMALHSAATITCESGGELCADIEDMLGLQFPCHVELAFTLQAD
jgi:hypothetical protein